MRLCAPVLGLAVLASLAGAQGTAPRWRFGVAVAGPADVLDNGGNHVKLAIGEVVEAARVWPTHSRTTGALVLRIATSAVNGEMAGTTWNAGRAFIVDLAVRAEHPAGERGSLFGGVGLSRWTGPSHTAPFTGAAAAQLAVEAGGAVRIGGGPWDGFATVHLDRFGPDDDRGVLSGSVFRWMVGVRRAY